MPKEVRREGRSPVRIKTDAAADAAKARTRRSRLRSAVNGRDAASSGAAWFTVVSDCSEKSALVRSSMILTIWFAEDGLDWIVGEVIQPS